MSRRAPDRTHRSADQSVVVIQPRRGWERVALGELWRARGLVASFVARDIRLRYRQTLLGALWVVVQPVAAAGILAFVFGRVAGLPSGGVDYFVFSFAGLLGWNLFSGIITKVGSSLLTNNLLVSKVYFPRLALPVSAAVSPMLDFLIALVVLLVLVASEGLGVGLRLLTLPVWAGAIALLAYGLGTVAASLMVRYRDVVALLPVVTQLALYASPVAYGLEVVPAGGRAIYSANPLVGLLEAVRWSLLPDRPLPLGLALYGAGVAVVVAAGGSLWFARAQRQFADVI